MMIMGMAKSLEFMRVRAGTMVSIATVVVMRMIEFFELVVTMRSLAMVVVLDTVRKSPFFIIVEEPCILMRRSVATTARMVLTSLIPVLFDIHGLDFCILELADFDTIVAAVGVCDWTS